jgi:hypothetical protein
MVFIQFEEKMMADHEAGSVAEPIAGLSQVERIVDTFTAPSKTFTDILRSTAWWAPFLLAVVFSITSAVVIDKQVGFEAVVQNSLHETPKVEEGLAQLEPKQRAAQIHGMAVGYRYTTYCLPALILLFAALGALVLWGTFNFVLGAKTTFGQMFAVWIYASLPRLISGLLMMVTLFFGGTAESFNIKNPVGTNLGFYMPDAAPWLKSVLSSFDLISLWVIALLILGTSIVAGVKRKQAAGAILGWWVLIVIAGAVAAAFNS